MEEKKSSIVQIDPGVKIRKPGQRRQLRIALVFIVIIIAAAVISWLLLNKSNSTYVLKNYNSAKVEKGIFAYNADGSGAVELAVQYILQNPETGYVNKLYVEEGESVSAGDLLAVLDVSDLIDQLADQKDSLEQSELSFERFKIQNEYSDMRSAREIASLEKDMEKAKTDLDTSKTEYEKGWISKSEYEAAQDNLKNLEDSLDDKKLSMEEDRRLYEIDLKINQASINDLENAVTDLEKRIASARITSPLSGDILSMNASLQVPGTELQSGVQLFTIGQPESAVAIVEVDDEYASLLNPGDKARMLIGSGSTWLEGTITSVGKVAVLSSDGVTSTIEVKIKPDEMSSSFLQGATVTAEFPMGESEEVLLLPRGAYLTTGSQKYVYLIEGKKAVRKEVEFGEIQDLSVQIISGLNAGDEVITSGYQNFIENEQINLDK